jgi:hypothetical protein
MDSSGLYLEHSALMRDNNHPEPHFPSAGDLDNPYPYGDLGMPSWSGSDFFSSSALSAPQEELNPLPWFSRNLNLLERPEFDKNVKLIPAVSPFQELSPFQKESFFSSFPAGSLVPEVSPIPEVSLFPDFSETCPSAPSDVGFRSLVQSQHHRGADIAPANVVAFSYARPGDSRRRHRAAHSLVERRRRDHINGRIEDLAEQQRRDNLNQHIKDLAKLVGLPKDQSSR